MHCDKHQGKKVAGGGTYCTFHQAELCKLMAKHCHECGVYLCECGGSYSRMDVFWKSRKWCNKCGKDYVDYSNDEMHKIFNGGEK